MTQPEEDFLVREDDFDDEEGDFEPDFQDLEAPADDAFEQAIPASPTGQPTRPRMPFEADEADALEQSQVVEIDDDYR
jgi:hypothetical protein